MTPRRFVAVRSAAVVSIAALVLVACSPDKEQISPTETAAPGPDVTDSPTTGGDPGASAVYDQTIEWSDCGELECATIQVPLDWSDPDGDTTDLALNRSRARDDGARIGSLLINPGGPGGSGLDLTEYFVVTAGDKLLDAYDVIGFDPRGVGLSSPVMCGSDETVDDYYIPDRPLETQADVEDFNALTQAFGDNCRVESGAIIENVDTSSAARDMDVIRALVGDEQLNYLGFSYGTQLGATYAELYPENVGRLVLDGAVDFLLPSIELARGQAEGFENALTNFLRWCEARRECALDGGIEDMRAQLSEMMDRSLTDPYFTGTDWELNGNLFVYGVVVTLYDEGSWIYLQQALQEIVDQDTGSIMYQLANFYLDRDPTSGEYSANSTWAFTAIGCLDEEPGDPWTIDDVEAFRAEMVEASPTFGWWFAASTGCDGWPFNGDEVVTSLEAAATANQMLVIGTTNDPATPLEWSESLADRLGASLLVYDGEGHTAYGRSNACIIEAVDGFLVDGVMPDSGTQC